MLLAWIGIPPSCLCSGRRGRPHRGAGDDGGASAWERVFSRLHAPERWYAPPYYYADAKADACAAKAPSEFAP